MDHLTLLGHLDNEQHGGRSFRSTLSQLLEQNDWVVDSLCSGSNVELLYLYFAKAFDLIDISILLTKLKKSNVTGKLLHWIRSFLMNRSQHVRVGNSLSNLRRVCLGVPQGSILGPILFLAYIADLQMEDNCKTMSKLSKYAKDSKVLTRT